ncbi:hypothetical protein Ciccas_006256 [Cichlidogyrus casuarinus]|uniref:Uncharacterized protein n=1 Tax=Cichlidogyrus casuarinus TaxID=1844966 RepID=A0ABD2Q6F0_9PLAT
MFSAGKRKYSLDSKYCGTERSPLCRLSSCHARPQQLATIVDSRVDSATQSPHKSFELFEDCYLNVEQVFEAFAAILCQQSHQDSNHCLKAEDLCVNNGSKASLKNRMTRAIRRRSSVIFSKFTPDRNFPAVSLFDKKFSSTDSSSLFTDDFLDEFVAFSQRSQEGPLPEDTTPSLVGDQVHYSPPRQFSASKANPHLNPFEANSFYFFACSATDSEMAPTKQVVDEIDGREDSLQSTIDREETQKKIAQLRESIVQQRDHGTALREQIDRELHSTCT